MLKDYLEEIYGAYHRRDLVGSDPLLFLYDYGTLADREVVGLIASGLAYGRVAQIQKSITRVLAPLGPHPALFLQENARELSGLYADFKHRFTTGEQIGDLLRRTAQVLCRYGGIEAFLGECLRRRRSLFEALDEFARVLCPPKPAFPLLTAPGDGSACKRLLLYLRWMVRSDEVDPGGWKALSPRDLVVPTDTHMHRMARLLSLTARRQADLRTAMEITGAFARLCPDDPVRYDFSLTRLGILRETEALDSFL